MSAPRPEASRILIFDTTLRDGEQSPGASLTAPEKVEIARALADLRVDVIEAGFGAASEEDAQGIAEIARTVGRADGAPVICSLARARNDDIDAAWSSVRHAARPRIHTFLATSPSHLEHKLRMTQDEVVDRVRDAVRHAASLCADVEFSAEDAGRTSAAFLCRVYKEAIRAGATTINIPDTVGYTVPSEFAAHVRAVVDGTPNIRRAAVSVHCHDDLGLATANTLAAIGAGARQAEVTLNGIGERAGNASLEEVVMALRTRRDLWDFTCGVDASKLAATSRLVSRLTGLPVQPNKAVVGANAFAHESGIHQDGVLKHASTYEIMRPEDVGLAGNTLTLGKYSGRHAVARRLHELGWQGSAEDLAQLMPRFKDLARRRKVVTDADLRRLLERSRPVEAR